MDALAAGHDTAVQMIDSSVVRVHQHGACVADNNYQDMGRSRGGLTSKIHAVVDANGLHGAPERRTQKMPLSTRRSFTRRTPRGLLGSIGLMAVHS
jgi:hypothetical protein